VYFCAIPQIIDVYRLAKETKLPVFCPHLDSLTPGRGTGRILTEAVKEAGAVGVLLNHAENRLQLNVISETVRRAREVGLISLVAVSSPEEAEIIAALRPEVIIAESPDRIGTLKSVGKDREFVVQSVKKVKSVDPDVLVVCGAGVSSGRDVAEVLKLGAEGTGASRAIFEAKDSAGLLTEMAKALDYGWKARRQKHTAKSN
jgi:triosephosphate isomerase